MKTVKCNGKRKQGFAVALTICGLLSLALPVSAADSIWNTTTSPFDWATPGNWTAGVPGTAEKATFNSLGGVALTARIGVDTTIGTLVFNNTQATTISSALGSNAGNRKTLTIGSGGITMASTAGSVNLSTGIRSMNVTLGSSQTWLNNNSASTLTMVLGSNSGTAPNTLALGANTLTIDGAGATTISSANMTGTAASMIIKNGTGTLTLSGATTFTGAVQVNAGTLALGNALALQNSVLDTSAIITGNAANGLKTTATTLTLGGVAGNKNFADVFTTTSGGYTGLTALTLNPGAGVTASYSADVGNGNGSMSLIKTNAGTQILSGTQSYTGATAVNGGTLLVNGTHAAAGAYTIATNATLGGSGAITNVVTLNDGGILAPGATLGTAGTLSVSNLTFNSASVATFDLATATTVGGGVNDLVAVNGDLAAGGTIQINVLSPLSTSGSYRLFNYSGNLTGSFAVTVLNPGYSATLDTNTANQVNVSFVLLHQTLTWKGTPALYDWDVNTSASWTNGMAMSVFQDGDIVVFDGTAETNVANLVGTLLPQSVTVNSGTSVTLQGSGSLSGGMSLSKAGSGTLTLQSANTYSGTTTISAGTLNAHSTDALGDGSSGNTLIFAGGILQAGGTITSPAARTVTLTSTGVIDSNDNDVNIAGLMSGAGGLTKNGSGTLTSSAFNTFTGPLTINNGTLEFRTLGFVYNTDVFKSTQININNGSTLRINSSIYNDVIPLFDGRTYTFDATGGGSLVLGTGNHNAEGASFTIKTLGGAQNTIGLITTSGENGFNLGGATVTFNVALGTDPTSDLTVTPIISNNGSVRKNGNGCLTLSGANTYRGTTAVNAGTLLVTGSHAAAGAYTIASGARLGGNGTINSAVTVNTNGTLAPGTNAVAGSVLACVGGLTLAAGATNAFDCAASSCDSVAVTGALTIQGANTVALTLTGTTVPNPITLFTFTTLSGEEYLDSWTVTGLPATYDPRVLRVNNSLVVINVAGTVLRLF